MLAATRKRACARLKHQDTYLQLYCLIWPLVVHRGFGASASDDFQLGSQFISEQRLPTICGNLYNWPRPLRLLAPSLSRHLDSTGPSSTRRVQKHISTIFTGQQGRHHHLACPRIIPTILLL
ncbi:hypothetical protein LX36DRAFT_473027 [Colletotrichum falcatum]|nr:hypothetical protein LX36DRAFT_473027 [Colletotrichum falcatum]